MSRGCLHIPPGAGYGCFRPSAALLGRENEDTPYVVNLVRLAHSAGKVSGAFSHFLDGVPKFRVRQLYQGSKIFRQEPSTGSGQKNFLMAAQEVRSKVRFVLFYHFLQKFTSERVPGLIFETILQEPSEQIAFFALDRFDALFRGQRG